MIANAFSASIGSSIMKYLEFTLPGGEYALDDRELNDPIID